MDHLYMESSMKIFPLQKNAAQQLCYGQTRWERHGLRRGLSLQFGGFGDALRFGAHFLRRLVGKAAWPGGWRGVDPYVLLCWVFLPPENS